MNPFDLILQRQKLYHIISACFGNSLPTGIIRRKSKK